MQEKEQETKEFDLAVRIPAGENSWVSNNQNNARNVIQKSGIKNWEEKNTHIKSYFRVNNSGQLNLGLNLKSIDGSASLKIKFGGETKIIKVDNSEFETIEIGTFDVKEKGYKSLEIIPIKKSGSEFPVIKEILVGGSATKNGVEFVEDNFHFGRRGPSDHLTYQVPEEMEVVWFYNEIKVPEGEDVVGSYFMANGFGQGYFGMQVNSDTERRILFSVWSPYETQNPEEIPEEYRIELLKKGEGVTTGKFGNEGSGGQSYKVFPWKSGNTYKFLLKGMPNGDGSTNFTAYFFAPEIGEWQLIASFRRPHTDTYLTHLYSFLENFVPATGDTSRKAFYKNQWVYDTKGNWTELTKAKFTADATADDGDRWDYAGGVNEAVFFLKNCGFFDDYTKMNTVFERAATNDQPTIDFESLER